MENKNTIIALVLMLIVWAGFTFLFPHKNQPASLPRSPENSSVELPSAVERTPVSESAKITTLSPDFVSDAVSGTEEEVVVEHPLYRAVFTNLGGRLKSFELKKYSAGPENEDGGVYLIQAESGRFSTLAIGGAGSLGLPSDAFYSIGSGKGGLHLKAGEEGKLTFLTRLPSGLTVEKAFIFNGDLYDFHMQVQIRNVGTTDKNGALTLSLIQPQGGDDTHSKYDFVGASTLAGGKVEKVSADKIGEAPHNYTQDLVWTGFGNKYFLSAVVPLQDSAAAFRLEQEGPVIRNIIISPEVVLAPGENAHYDYLVYLGPRDLDILKQVGHQLGEAVDFGFFSLIARPLLHTLKFFYRFLGNYGLAIILLTVIIKLCFWPLTQKSYSSMKSMQKLQPQMQKIREKHGKDRERLNREIMELYKTHRVNPLGGCLPMIVQIPVFFALYKTLMEAIELRHAPFYFWITDLSAKDPYYITPLVMGATMFLQQKMSPSTMDPKQAKLFMFMPVIFTFMFLNFPSGLVIYWLVNNILTIGQQYYINKKA